MSHAKRIAIAMVLCGPMAFGLVPSDASAQTDLLDGLDEYITKSMTEWQVPGLAIAIVKDDSVVFMGGYGVREVGRDVPVDAHTVFALGSNTKAFTAAAVAILVDEGKVSWDDPVIEHLAEFQLPDAWVTREVTVRDLLAHRVAGDLGRGAEFHEEQTSWEALRRLRFLELSGPRFRSGFEYCNHCYVAAGELVAAVSKMPWSEFLKARVLDPLGMSSAATSVYELWDADEIAPCWVCELRDHRPGAEQARVDNIVLPHISDDSGLRSIAWRSVDTPGPAAALNANVEDVAKWISLLLGNGTYAGKRLLSGTVVEEMFAPQVTRQPPWWYPGGEGSGHFWAHGFGWNLMDYRGRKTVMHGGAVIGQTSFIALMPEERLGVTVLINKQTLLPMALPFRVFDAFLGARERDWSGELLSESRRWKAQQQAREEKLAASRVKGTAPSVPIEKCLGSYAHPAFSTLILETHNGNVVLHPAGEPGWPVEHWHYDIYRVSIGEVERYNAFLRFEVSETGEVESLRIWDHKYERVRKEPR